MHTFTKNYQCKLWYRFDTQTFRFRFSFTIKYVRVSSANH